MALQTLPAPFPDALTPPAPRHYLPRLLRYAGDITSPHTCLPTGTLGSSACLQGHCCQTQQRFRYSSPLLGLYRFDRNITWETEPGSECSHRIKSTPQRLPARYLRVHLGHAQSHDLSSHKTPGIQPQRQAARGCSAPALIERKWQNYVRKMSKK